ncbi:MAG: SRPBCC family protein, partial [Polyangiales bacterium]
PGTLPDWLPSMFEVRNVIGTGAGQQYEWTYKMAGLLLRGQSTGIEHVPDERAVHQNIGMIGAIWGYTVEPHQEGTTLTIDVEYSIPIPVLGKLAEHIAIRRNKREFDMALTNVKETLEG